MYRKTPSNPDTDAGQGRDVRLGIQQLGNGFRLWVERPPLHALAAMLACILVSGIVAFTVMRPGPPPGLAALPQPPPSSAGRSIGGIVRTYGTLREISGIQQEIQAIIEKGSLGTADSVRLIEALQRYERLQQNISENKNSEP